MYSVLPHFSLSISRIFILELFASIRKKNSHKIFEMFFDGVESMSQLSENVTYNSTNSGGATKSATISRGLLSVFYVVGIIGSFLALIHLYKKRNGRNGKQIFMLKWVVDGEFGVKMVDLLVMFKKSEMM